MPKKTKLKAQPTREKQQTYSQKEEEPLTLMSNGYEWNNASIIEKWEIAEKLSETSNMSRHAIINGLDEYYSKGDSKLEESIDLVIIFID